LHCQSYLENYRTVKEKGFFGSKVKFVCVSDTKQQIIKGSYNPTIHNPWTLKQSPFFCYSLDLKYNSILLFHKKKHYFPKKTILTMQNSHE
jgi:hypothetical protein